MWDGIPTHATNCTPRRTPPGGRHQPAHACRHFVAANELGEYDVIKLITAIRKGVRAGTAPAEVIASLAQRSWWDTEDNLIPVDPSDPLLFFDVGTADFERAAADADPPRQGTKGGVCLEDVGPSVHDEGKTATLKALQEENDLLRDALESLRGAMGPGWTEEEEAGPSGTG